MSAGAGAQSDDFLSLRRKRRDLTSGGWHRLVRLAAQILAAGLGGPGPERVRGAVPMKRIGEPDEIADGVVYLLSDRASYVTGTFLEVSGGR